MSEPTAPDWTALAEALEACHGGYNDEGVPSLVGEGVANVWRAARWALEHAPALEAAETVWWCEYHEARGGAAACRYGYLLDDPGDCRMVQRRLLPPTGEAQ